jgi:hypothetical protein
VNASKQSTQPSAIGSLSRVQPRVAPECLSKAIINSGRAGVFAEPRVADDDEFTRVSATRGFLALAMRAGRGEAVAAGEALGDKVAPCQDQGVELAESRTKPLQLIKRCKGSGQTTKMTTGLRPIEKVGRIPLIRSRMSIAAICLIGAATILLERRAA